MTGIEPVTSSLPRKRSTSELHRPKKRARDRARTGDSQLGRLKLYQLSYSRNNFFQIIIGNNNSSLLLLTSCGERRIRTFEACAADLQSALVGHLSISPFKIFQRSELKKASPSNRLETRLSPIS